MKSIYLKKENRDGFTLIELLIVMSCFLVINLTVVGLFNLAVNSDGGRPGSFHKIGQQRTVFHLIAKDIRQADSIEKSYKNWKTSTDSLIIKSSDGNRIIYSRDTNHPDYLNRIQVNPGGREISMIILRDLDDIQFQVNQNRVSVKLKTLESRYLSNHSRLNQLTMNIRNGI